MLVTDFILSYILKISKRYGRYICCFGIFACFYLFSVTQKKHKLLFRYPLKSLSLLSWNNFIFYLWCGVLCRNLLGEEMENRVPFFFFFLFSFSLLLLLLLELSSAQMPGSLFFAFAYFKFLFYSSIGFHKDWVFSALAPFSALGVLF